MYKNELNKLKVMLDEEVWEILAANKAIVAGGAITSLFTNKEINDIDVYLPSKRAVVNILADAFREEEYTETSDYLNEFQLRFVNISDKSITFSNNGVHVQLITFKEFESAEDIFDTFDFTCCMGAYDVAEDKFIFHDDFFKHNSQRYLKFHAGTAFPLVSLLRVAKYQERGYSISKSEMLRIILKCMDLSINSWEEVKEHMGGMYGLNMDDFFDETKEFSLMEVISQMENKDYDKREFIFFPPDFVMVLEKFDSAKEIIDPEHPYKEGMFYKNVSQNFNSLYSGWGVSNIDYTVGNVVNGGPGGIYIHANPKQPYTSEGICIELEPVGNYSFIGEDDGKFCDYNKERRIVGDLKVTRVVEQKIIKNNALTKYEVQIND